MGSETTTGQPSGELLARFEQSRWTVPALLALAIALRLAFILAFPMEPDSDGAWYMERAAEISAGIGYQEAGHPTAFWPVGYPAAAALSMMVFGPGLPGPLILNLISAAAILLLIGWFGRKVAGSELAGRIAMLLYAVYPAHIAYTGAPLSEPISTALLMAAFAALIRGSARFRWFAVAGLLFGLATLMRPQFVLFPAGALVALWLLRRDLRWQRALAGALALYTASFAVILPWSLRNVDQLGSFVFVSTNGGVALITGANDLATGGHMHIERSPLWAEVGIPWDSRVERQVEIDARLKAMATDWIAQHPGEWAAMGVRKVVLLWLKDTDGFWGFAESYPDDADAWRALQWANQLFYVLMMGLAGFAFFAGFAGFVRGRDNEAGLLLLACTPVFVTLLAFGFTGQTRYHYPAMPFVLVAAGWSATRALGSTSLRSTVSHDWSRGIASAGPITAAR